MATCDDAHRWGRVRPMSGASRDLTDEQNEAVRQLVRDRLLGRPIPEDTPDEKGAKTWTWTSVARGIGVDPSGFSRVGRGEQGFAVRTAALVCELAGTTLAEVLGELDGYRAGDDGEHRYDNLEETIELMGSRWLPKTASALRSIQLKREDDPPSTTWLKIGNEMDDAFRRGAVDEGREMTSEDDEVFE